MEDHRSTPKRKQAEFTEASTSTMSKRPRPDLHQELFESQSDDHESELPLLLPSSDSSEKLNVPLASGANSDPSASSTSVIGNNYYVFLSFRGPDTRNGFTDHLYHKLLAVGLPFHPNFVFRDDEKLPFGENIAERLFAAIKHSKISIPVISVNYAASKWCLNEIIQIMECVERGEQKVLPVLYKVKPDDVKRMEGEFGKAFQNHKGRFDEDLRRQGEEALKKAVASRVFESEKFANGSEAQLVEELVKKIMDEQQHDFTPSLPVDLVGIDDHAAKVMNLADTAFRETRIIVIHGIGGIGKTTLATFIYKKLFDQFNQRSFLEDIRQTIKSKGMEHVQSLLISDIAQDRAFEVRNSKRGIEGIRSSCKGNKVLILLDDVDCQDHLDNLIGGCNFGSGSRIIITCRDKALLKPEYKEYKLEEMNTENSLLLFRKYAIEREQPRTKLTALSREIVNTIGGLPLALVIIGSLLKGKHESIWKETLEKLSKVPDKNVQKILRITYDSLEFEEQQMFLDIACFFIGIEKRIATYLWEDLQWCPHSGLDRMIELSLLKIDAENKLRLHDHIRDFGRVIARPADKKPWECSRLWGEEAITVQRSKEENRNIEALRLDEKGSRRFIERGSFTRMPYLKFLHLSKVEFAGDFEESLSELRWLEWEKCPDSFEAANVHLEKLLILHLSGGFISENWEGWSSIKMERLKVLNLSGCSFLKSTPNLSVFKSLEMLILERCPHLEEIDPSIGDVKCLVSLNLRDCGWLKNLPARLGELRKLEELLVDCTYVEEIPACMQFLTELKMLSVSICDRLTRVPSSISHLVNLSTLNLDSCGELRELPDIFEALGKLQHLLLGGCWGLKQIPSSIGKLGELVELDLSETEIKELPESIGELKKLEILWIRSHTRIKELPESIGELKKLKILDISDSKIERLPSTIGQLESLQELHASECHELKGEILVDKGGWPSLGTLRLDETKISRLPKNFHELSTLEHLDLLYCSELESPGEFPSGLSSLRLTCRSDTLPSLSHLTHLKVLQLAWCESLQSIPELPPYIRELEVWECPELEGFPNLSHLKSLKSLKFCGAKISRLPENFHELSTLEHLDLLYSWELESLLEFPTGLSSLKLTCRSNTLPSLHRLSHLKGLYLYSCESLQSIPKLPPCIQELCVVECPKLERLPNLSDLKSLRKLELSRCNGLKELDGLEASESLRELDVSISTEMSISYDGKVDDLREIPVLCQLKSLQVLDISGRKHITVLDLSNSKDLMILKVNNCESLDEIRFHENIKSLQIFQTAGCKSHITRFFST